MPEKEPINEFRIRAAARDEIRHFDNRAWLALSRLTGDHFPFTESDKIDLLAKIKRLHVAGELLGRYPEWRIKHERTV